MGTKPRAQIALQDTILEHNELRTILEDREALKEKVADYNRLDKAAKAIIAGIETPTPYRVGRFIIDSRTNAPKSVSFETQGSFTFTIKVAGEE